MPQGIGGEAFAAQGHLRPARFAPTGPGASDHPARRGTAPVRHPEHQEQAPFLSVKRMSVAPEPTQCLTFFKPEQKGEHHHHHPSTRAAIAAGDRPFGPFLRALTPPREPELGVIESTVRSCLGFSHRAANSKGRNRRHAH